MSEWRMVCSMAALADGETVKAPGTLVVSGYCTTPNFTLSVTPDLKGPLAGVTSTLVLIDLGGGVRNLYFIFFFHFCSLIFHQKDRLGGSALTQVFNQAPDEVPDVEEVDQLKAAFLAVQELLDHRKILAGHDRSDGGLITTLLGMT